MGPLIEGGSFPDWVEVQANGVAGRNNSTRNDVVAIHQCTCNRLADAVDVNRRCGDESDDEAGGSCKQCGDHQNTKPTDIKTVVGGGDPLTELLPAVSAGALLDGGSHEYGKEGLARDGYGRAGRPAPC